ncbi:MAG: bifunctional DNA primase/polymerase [Deltaproteobacteria bacterium]|nr:bifunctional DNA primase/polymerase [Deltaproteobacteria bacterium]
MSDLTAFDHAIALLARGFSPIPVPFRSKKARLPAWSKLRLRIHDLPSYFEDPRANIGVLLGEPSSWMVDVDLDHPRAVELADKLLPPTGMTWGRASKPRSHRIYRLTRPAKTKKWLTGNKEMIVEIRSTGCQTLAPGSTHPSGEAVRWDDEGEPASIDPDELIAACEKLVAATRNCDAGTTTPTTKDPVDPVDPIDPVNPVDPIRTMTTDQVIEMSRVTGAGQHDAKTLMLARGLKWNAGVSSVILARPHFDKWWQAGHSHCADRDADAAWFKFERAWDTANVPLATVGVAAGVLMQLDSLLDVPGTEMFGSKLRRFVTALHEMSRRSRGQPFAISAYMVSEAFDVGVATAHEWFQGLLRRGMIECTDKGKAGANGKGRARRIRWIGCQCASPTVVSDREPSDTSTSENGKGAPLRGATKHEYSP